MTVSPEAERTAMLSELKVRVLASVRWPPSVSREVLVPVGFFSVVFRVYVSTVLFCSNKAIFISPEGERRQSTDLKNTYINSSPLNIYEHISRELQN